MLKSIGRAASAVVQLLIPEAEAQACTDAWCETSATKGKRCCKLCPGNHVACTPWGTGCPNGCAAY